MCNLQKNVAIIDIGSNSVRIRISCEGKVFYRNTITTQLAKDISCGLLNEQSVKRTFLALDELIERANKENAQIYAFATAAVRNAVNGKAFCAQFFTRYNIELDVLSGKNEAQMGILGALQGGNGCVIDVGGASSELVIANNNRIVYTHSMQLGAVVLTDLCAKNIYDANKKICENMQNFPPIGPIDGEIYAIGGTANVIAFIKSGLSVYDREKTNGLVVTKDELYNLVKDFYCHNEDYIVKKYKVNFLRAKVIHSGALLLHSLLTYAGKERLVLSENDNLEGYYLAKILGKGYEN